MRDGGSRRDRLAGVNLRRQKLPRYDGKCSPHLPPIRSLSHASPHALVLARRADTDDLGETIAALAARLHAATYELLVLLREFDAARRAGTTASCRAPIGCTGEPASISAPRARRCASPRRCQPCRGSARPCSTGRSPTPRCGRSRAWPPPTTRRRSSTWRWPATARTSNAVVRAWRRVDRVQAAQETETRHLQRQLSTWVDDDGMVVIRGRLTPEMGAVVQRALEAAADRLFREGGRCAER